jgi:hypothetical protein
MLSVVTSFGPQGWELYGRKFIDSFHEFWPLSARLIVYWEGERPDYPGEMDGFDLLKLEPCKSFIERHANDETFKGKLEYPLSPWGAKARRLGYSFRHDAYKFARKVFAVAHAAREVERGRLFWIDADTVTFERVPDGLFASLLPNNASLCYLSRAAWGYPSELGFVGYNLERLETHAFIAAYESQYANDDFIRDPAWDDCSQFDRLCECLAPHANLIAHNAPGHPFDHSILGQYIRHNKGKRKCQ